MSSEDTHRSLGRRVYERLFKIMGPAQVSEAESPESEISENERARTEQLAEWEKETRDGRSYLVRKQEKD